MSEFKNLSGQWMCMDMDDPFCVDEDKGLKIQCELCRQLCYGCDIIEIYSHRICVDCCEEILDIYTERWRRE